MTFDAHDVTMLATLADQPVQAALDYLYSIDRSPWHSKTSSKVAEALIREAAGRTKARDQYTQAAVNMLLWAANNRIIQAPNHHRHQWRSCRCIHCRFVRSMPKQERPAHLQ